MYRGRPGIWDDKFYGETYQFARNGTKPDSIFGLPSDKNLALHPVVGPQFRRFVGAQGLWSSKYVTAMGKLSTFGNVPRKMADCTLYVSGATPREARYEKPGAQPGSQVTWVDLGVPAVTTYCPSSLSGVGKHRDIENRPTQPVSSRNQYRVR
jgi:hypothetical protein